MGRSLNRKQVKEYAKAIMESGTLKEAYAKTHPKASPHSARCNAHRMLENAEVLKEYETMFQTAMPTDVTKEKIVKLFYLVVVRWHKGEEKTENMLRACENLSKLVPEFIDRHEVSAYKNMSEDDLNRELKRRFEQFGSILQ